MKYAVLRKKTLLISCAAVCLSALAGFGIFRWCTTAGAKEANAQQKVPIYSVQTDQKQVSLGINCAWGDDDLDQWLSILDSRQVKATFFLVGDWCDKYPEAAKKIADAGHELGNHSNTHPDMTKLSEKEIEQELTGANDRIQKLTGTCPKLFRAPSGAYNDRVLTTAEKLGFTTIQWNVEASDTKRNAAKQIMGSIRIDPIICY